MPQNESFRDESPRPDGHGFEDDLGAVLRRTAGGFAADDRRGLVEGGLRRGRRRLVRRRLAVAGGVLALATVAVGGVYGGALLGPEGETTKTSVAAPPKPTRTGAAESAGSREPHEAQIPVEDLAAVLKAHTPAGKWTIDDPGGKGQSVSGVYDDGRGEAAVGVGLYRAGRGSGETGEDQVTCPDEVFVPYDACTSEKLPGGGRLMVLQGYEYPDKREETKNWRAVLLTRDGFLVDVSEYNAAAQKGAPVSRKNPPFTAAQLKALVTADAWKPFLAQLPALPTQKPTSGTGIPGEPGADAMRSTLRSLLPGGLKVKGGDGQSGYAYAVVDDGRGRSLVEINVQSHMEDVAGHIRSAEDFTTLPDGRLVGATKQAGEKGGAGVVQWTVDTLTPEGFRVVVSAYNTGGQHQDATRDEPALSVKQLRTIALSPKWKKAAE